MKTADRIKICALKRFNTEGCRAVTLRDIASDMNKSYGNITYHFKKKSDLIMSLYADMVTELSAALNTGNDSRGLFESILEAPAISWTVSVKYQFLFRDYAELMNDYPALAKHVKKSNEDRKLRYLKGLKGLQTEGLLDADLSDEDLLYLMELSGAMRTWFFIEHSPVQIRKKTCRSKYIDSMNKLLYPYLSKKGKRLYKALNRAISETKRT